MRGETRFGKQVKREILINVSPLEKRIAILEDGKLAEIFFERPTSRRTIGNIYKGRVNAVLPGLQAAFVDIGQEKAGFLHVEDAVDRDLSLRREYDDEDNGAAQPEAMPTIDRVLKVGQEILVQVTKEQIGTKGPRLTTHLTFAGRFLVCMPGTDFIGVSKKSRDPQRRRQLKGMIRELKSPGLGYIVRTIGLGESEDEFRKQMKLLEAKWIQCKQTADSIQAPATAYEESESTESTLRDYFSDVVESVVVDSKDEYKDIVSYLSVLSPDMVDRVQLFKESASLFAHYGISEEVQGIFAHRVPLRRGGYLIIDQTEALVAIDVNTGGKVGGFSQSKNIVETNMDAAWEVAQQARLRDLGGLIVVDFIDMDNDSDNELVEREFKKAIRSDKAPISFAPISQFGLMSITRKRVRQNTVSEQSRPCPTCDGAGIIPSPETVAASIDRWFARLRAEDGEKKVTLALHPQMVDYVLQNRAYMFKYWEMTHKTQIQLVEDENAHFSKYRMFATVSGEELTPSFMG